MKADLNSPPIMSKHKSRYTLYFLIVVGILSLIGYETTRRLSGTMTSMPEWDLEDLYGNTFNSQSLQGKVVLINFWSILCSGCRDEIPGFIELQDKYGQDGFQIIGIEMDDNQPQKILAFVKGNQINYSVLHGNAEVAEEFRGISDIPHSFLFDREGNLVKEYKKPVLKNELEEALKNIL